MSGFEATPEMLEKQEEAKATYANVGAELKKIYPVLTDEALKEKILKNQRTRLQDFDNQKVKTRFLQIIEKIIREN